MSLTPCVVTCSNCDYTATHYYKKISLNYVINGINVKGFSDLGWCHDCDRVVYVEDISVERVKLYLLEIETAIENLFLKTFKLTNFFSRINKSKHLKEQFNIEHGKLKNGINLLEMFLLRSTPPRCLSCFNQNIILGKPGISGDIIKHSCGGILKFGEFDDNAPRFHLKPIVIFFDADGLPLNNT